MHPDDGRVVSNFIVQALKQEPLTVHGDGNQSRSFCYIDDLLDGILKLMEVDYRMPLNLGNPSEYRIIELAEVIVRLCASTSKIERRPPLEDDPKRRCPDIGKAKEVLAWQPTVPLEEGVRKTIEYFKNRIFG
jgi:nucleoside-diphosphate-sugar epimerase